jgi:CDP-diacylglycerol---serine O-phosphatidyltransferase
MTSMIRLIKIPDFLTIGNLVCGLLAIFAAIDGDPLRSAALIVAAMVMDAFDGKVAQWLNQKNPMGRELDSLADLVSFGVTPAVIFYLSDASESVLLKSVIAAIFVSCGMLRLARYNISESAGFEGVPITINGVLFPILILFGAWHPELYAFWPAILVIQSLLMVSSIRIPRIF